MSRSRFQSCRWSAPLVVALAAALAVWAPGSPAVAQTDPPPAPAASALPDLFAADASPSPVPATLAQYGGDPPHTTGQGRHKESAFHHLLLEPTLAQSVNFGSDTIVCFHATTHVGCKNPTTAVLPGDLLRWAGNARWYFNRHLGVRYQRIAHLGVAGRTGGSGANAKFGGSGYDYEELESLEWSFNPLLTVNAGWDYRARVCCPGAGDPTNPTPREKQGPFLQASWRTGPDTRIGRILTLSLRTTFVNHRFEPTAQSVLARGQTDAGRKNEYVPTAYLNLPVYGQTKVVPFYGIEYYGTYFDNQPSISLTYRKTYGFNYRASKLLSFRAQVKNDQNYAAGPDAAHKAFLQLEATYRIEK